MVDINKTDITVILDRSGSMERIASDMVGGFNSFIEKQKALPGQCLVSLYQFDDKYDEIYAGRLIQSVPPLVLEPRGMTAMLDAVGKTVISTGFRLAKMPEEQRPGAVIMLIITDGLENASKEYTYAQVRQMIQRQETEFNWQFAYLGSDPSTQAEASKIGTQAMGYEVSEAGVRGMYGAVGQSIGNLRSATSKGAIGVRLDLGGNDKKSTPKA